MRSFLRAMVLALAIGPLTPELAFCQDEEVVEVVEYDDAPPPPRWERRRGRGGWKSSPIVWGTVAAVLAVAIPVSLYKLAVQMKFWAQDQAREKEPWERAMEEAERNRLK
ncbi:MAG: hypothetical protein HY289_12445 [Planctomycetes bacterium]|nr:hypothetical protein [Planctomycetota bacterium]